MQAQVHQQPSSPEKTPESKPDASDSDSCEHHHSSRQRQQEKSSPAIGATEAEVPAPDGTKNPEPILRRQQLGGRQPPRRHSLTHRDQLTDKLWHFTSSIGRTTGMLHLVDVAATQVKGLLIKQRGLTETPANKRQIDRKRILGVLQDGGGLRPRIPT